MFTTPPLDELRGRIKPTSLGHEAGEAGAPPLDAKDDPHEQPIVDEIRRLVDDARSRLDGQLDQARKHLADIDIDPLGDINAAVMEAESQFNGVAEIRRPELQDKRLEQERRRADLAQFRREQDLDRSPHYPEAGSQVFWYGLVAALFVFESFANSVFLARANEGGILGAYTIAFGISFANLVPPLFFFGPFSRNFQHVRPARRVLAGLATCLFLVLVLVLNLGVAHYREVAGQLIGDGGAEVVQRMTEAPLSLQEAQSWLLFVIGLIFSFIAFFDGWKLDDAYPGYGKLDRILRNARKDFRRERDEVAEELDEILRQALDQLRQIASVARKQPQEHMRVVLHWRELCDAFEHHVEDLHSVGSTLIDEYREANRSARRDGGVPVAHQVPWRAPETREVVQGALDGFDADSGQRIERIEQEYRAATDRIHARCEAVRKRLLGVEDPTVPNDAATTAAAARNRE